MPLAFTLNPNETPEQAMLRYARPYGLEWEVLREFKAYKEFGKSDLEAAFEALSEWDLLDYVPD